MATVEIAREDLYRRFTDALKQGDANAVTILHAPDAEIHMPFAPERIKGREAIRKFNETFLKALGNVDIRTLSVATRGDVLAAEFVLTARHAGPIELPTGTLPATNREITLPAATFFRYNREGQIAEARAYLDMAGFLKQLGAKP